MTVVRIIVGMLFLGMVLAFVATVLGYSIVSSDGHYRGGLALFAILLISSICLFGDHQR